MADNIYLTRKGKQLWLSGMMVAECANEGIAAVLQLSLNRGTVTKQEADVFKAVFNG
jgi:hypothetical protein